MRTRRKRIDLRERRKKRDGERRTSSNTFPTRHAIGRGDVSSRRKEEEREIKRERYLIFISVYILFRVRAIIVCQI